MRKINRPSKRQVLVACVALLFFGSIGLSAYSVKQVGVVKEDLSNFQKDYENAQTSHEDESLKKVEIEVLSQSVKDLRVTDSDYVYTEESPEMTYKNTKVRVVEVRVTNNTDYVYSLYSPATYDEDRVIIRPVEVHPADDQNEPTAKYTVELGTGGTTTRYLYFLDTGNEIETVFDSDQGAV